MWFWSVNRRNNNLAKCKNYKIDTSNVIQGQISIPLYTKVTYTATEKCFIEYSGYGANNDGAFAQINGISIDIAYSPSNITSAMAGITPMLDVGDEFSLYTALISGTYIVYGIKEYS